MGNLISDITVRVLEDAEDSNVKAYGSALIAGVLRIRGLKVVKSKNTKHENDGDLFVAFPAYLRQDGQFQEIYLPVDKKFRAQLQKAVLMKYREHTEAVTA